MLSQRIAFFASASKLISIIGGPLTILFISSELSNEELGFYYVFLSLVATRQFFEMGMSNVLKQYYSHNTSESNRKYREEIYSFSIYWYLLVAILFAVFGVFLGWVNFQSYDGEINWKVPYYFLMITSALQLVRMIVTTYMDGNQLQEKLHKIEIVTNLVQMLSLWFCLKSSFGLYSIALSQVVSIVVFVLVINFFCTWERPKYKGSDFCSLLLTLKKIWPLLHKVTLVSLFSYLYWNAFNIISFNVLGAVEAGAVGLSFSMARTGLNLATTLTSSQVTLVSKYISELKIEYALKLYSKQFMQSLILAFTGYFSFIILYKLYPKFYFFEKILEFKEFIFMCIYFFVVATLANINTLVRCFKIEPFVTQTFVNSIITPVSFYLSIKYELYLFLLPSIVQILAVINSVFILKSTLEYKRVKSVS
ncbi:O81 family O-antigen flippase [Vibrio cholerae]